MPYTRRWASRCAVPPRPRARVAGRGARLPLAEIRAQGAREGSGLAQRYQVQGTTLGRPHGLRVCAGSGLAQRYSARYSAGATLGRLRGHRLRQQFPKGVKVRGASVLQVYCKLLQVSAHGFRGGRRPRACMWCRGPRELHARLGAGGPKTKQRVRYSAAGRGAGLWGVVWGGLWGVVLPYRGKKESAQHSGKGRFVITSLFLSKCMPPGSSPQLGFGNSPPQTFMAFGTAFLPLLPKR